MGFRKRTIKTYEAIKKLGKKSVAALANYTGNSKSSTYRQQQVIERRITKLGTDFFETKQGSEWLTRLVLSALFIFGIQAGVGAERISLFFLLINIDSYVGTSAATINRLENQLRNLMKKYEEEQLPAIKNAAKDVDLIAGGDETFFDRLMILVFMDLPSGFIILEKQTEDRKTATWKNCTNSFVKYFKSIRCLVSDRAKALIKLSKEYGCQSIADLFHMLMKTVNLLKFSFSRQLRSLDKKEKALFDELKKSIDKTEIKQIKVKLNEIEKSRIVINQGQTTYRQELHAISTTVHPFTLESEKQSSKEITEKLHVSLTTLRSVVADCKVDDKKDALGYFEKQIVPLSSLTDLWWQWIETDLSFQTQSIETKTWLKEYLLPHVYWQQQIKKSKATKSLREFYKDISITAEKKLMAHPLTTELLTAPWLDWAKNMCRKYQRTTSPIEGRNGQLSLANHCTRGMTELQLESETIIHNYWIKRDDETTAVERAFGFKPPDLFEWLVKNMGELPLPRKRNKVTNINTVVPLIAAAA